MSELNRIYRRCDLHAVTGLKDSRIDELIREGQFPAPIKLTDGGRASGWLESDLIEWQKRRIAKRDAQPRERIRLQRAG
jgi:predicted DNA-binding transcriptional regulator AlpA